MTLVFVMECYSPKVLAYNYCVLSLFRDDLPSVELPRGHDSSHQQDYWWPLQRPEKAPSYIAKHPNKATGRSSTKFSQVRRRIHCFYTT